jgi:competence protein ComEC
MRTGKLRLYGALLAAIGLILLASIAYERAECRVPTFKATFLDVGQGDCAFLRTPSGKTVLVDGGGSSERLQGGRVGYSTVVPYLRRQGANQIDVLVLTHPHDDHLQGLLPVIEGFRVGMVVDPAIPNPSKAYRKFLSVVKSRRISYHRAVRGQKIDFGDGVVAEVLNPPARRLTSTKDDTNSNSAVLRFVYGKSALLMAADSSVDSEADMLAARLRVKSDVLKIGHHGSSGSTSDRWLDAVKPRMAVISVGRNNPFGHPSQTVLDRLHARRIYVFRTDRNGAVTVRFTRTAFSMRTALPSSR